MSKLILKFFSIILVIYLLSLLIDTIVIGSFPSLLIMGIVLLIVNLLLKPILYLITLPVSILTLGLFTFVVNALTIMIADRFVPGISMGGFFNSLILHLHFISPAAQQEQTGRPSCIINNSL